MLRSFTLSVQCSYTQMIKYSKEENAEDARKLFDMVNAIRTCPVPVIARVNGACLGGGGGLVAACDMAFALKTAKFGFTVSRPVLPFLVQSSRFGNRKPRSA